MFLVYVSRAAGTTTHYISNRSDVGLMPKFTGKFYCGYDDMELVLIPEKEVNKKDQAKHPKCNSYCCPECDYGMWARTK